MMENAETEADERWLEYLHVMQSFVAEMNTALSALAGNDLQRFESSVAAQEQLCKRAHGLFQLIPRQLPPRSLKQLAAAGRELRHQNRGYAAVLTRAAQVCSALLLLYQDSPRGYSPDGRAVPASHTWSCEV